MLSDEAGMAGIWWPAFEMNGQIMDEILDNLSYLHEVTNAYATELIWTLAVALGFLCLYIWRALGLQEADHKHSQISNSRPVFTTILPPTVASANSSFSSSYKSRFAQNAKCNEERMNAVGYDTLNMCNVTPYARHTVPRAVWKRHVTDTENEQLLQPEAGTGRNVLWDNDSSHPVSHWGSQPRVASAFVHAAEGSSVPASKPQPPVPAQRTRRPENTQAKPASVQAALPYVFNRAPQQLQELCNYPAQTSQPAPQPNRRVTLTCDSRDSERMEGAHTQDTEPCGPEGKLQAQPAAREVDEMITTQSVKLADHFFLLSQALEEMKQKHKKVVGDESKERHGDQIEVDLTKNDAHNSDDKNDHLSTNIVDKGKAFSEQHQLSENNEGLNGRDVEKRPRRRYKHPNEDATEQKKNICGENAQSDNASNSQSSRSKAGEEELMEEVLGQKLVSQDSSGNTSATSTLDSCGKSFCMDQQETDQETLHTHSPKEDRCSSETLPLMSKIDSPSPWKNSSIPVCRKLPIPVPKPDFSHCSTDKSKNAQMSNLVNKESYDSAVLRAIKDEEEYERSQNPSKNSLHTSSEEAFSGLDRKKRSKTGSADDEYDQRVVHEAGCRLSRLRKRLENSLQLMQKQPGLDKQPLVKPRTQKVKTYRDDLDILLSKDDVELSSLGTLKNDKTETKSDVKTQPELTKNIRSKISTDTAVKGEDKQKGQVPDGVSSGSTGTTQTVPLGKGDDLPGTAPKADKSKVLVNNRVASDKKIEPFCLADSSAAAERTQDRKEETCAEKENKGLLTNVDCNLLAVSAERLYPKSCPKIPSEQSENKQDGDLIHETNTEIDKDVKGLFSAGGKVDEERLEAILEQQSKRREALKQRKKRHIELMSAGATGCEVAHAENVKPDLHNDFEGEHPTVIRENSDPISEQCTDSGANEININKTANVIGDSQPKTSDLEASKPTSRGSDQTEGEQSPLEKNMSDSGLHLSERTFGHMKYKEPDVQLSKADPTENSTVLKNSFKFMNGEMKLVPERESMARRRLRWRRQAERERLHQEADGKKTPPPVPPKMTHLNKADENTEPSYLPHGDNVAESNQQNTTQDSKEMGLNVLSEDTTSKIPDADSSMIKNSGLVRGSFNCTIRHKNTVLGAGETGIMKGTAENEICEEKSLLPSKAASVFDPQVQEQKEKKKQNAERAVRTSSREGMSSLQFKANLLLFEQAKNTNGDKLRGSKVKANVLMFEEVSSAQRAHSVSPERKRNERNLRSPSFPRPSLDINLAG